MKFISVYVADKLWSTIFHPVCKLMPEKTFNQTDTSDIKK